MLSNEDKEEVKKLIEQAFLEREDIEIRLKRYFAGARDKKVFRGLSAIRKNIIRGEVLFMFYRDGMTMLEIADAYHVSYDTARRDRKEQLNILKMML